MLPTLTPAGMYNQTRDGLRQTQDVAGRVVAQNVAKKLVIGTSGPGNDFSRAVSDAALHFLNGY